jgi:hypothetical protein
VGHEPQREQAREGAVEGLAREAERQRHAVAATIAPDGG